MLLGGGRAKKGDQIDHAVGIVLHAKAGKHVTEGQPLLTIHANDEGKLAGARQRLLSAYEWSEKELELPPVGALPKSEILAKLEALGYTQIVETEFEDGVWEVEYVVDSEERELLVDPMTGEILPAEDEEEPDETMSEN